MFGLASATENQDDNYKDDHQQDDKDQSTAHGYDDHTCGIVDASISFIGPAACR